MGNLYKDLASVYEAMYQSFIDYQAEYDLYSGILKKNNKQQVLEIGCGTGNLVPFFLKDGFDYIGLDLNKEMIALAKDKVPNGTFIQGDMQHFQLVKPVESILITARTISYLLTNQELLNTFSTIANNLKVGGILSFDFIDANQFMPIVAQSDEIIHNATTDQMSYVRKSKWELLFDYGMGFKWDSVYYKKEGENLIEIGRDNSNLRTFTCDELRIFLELSGFQIREFIPRKTYAFPTFVLVAEKV